MLRDNFLQLSPSLASVDNVRLVLLRRAQSLGIGSSLFASLHIIYYLKMQIKRRVHILCSTIGCPLTRTRSKFEFSDFKTRETRGRPKRRGRLGSQALWCQDPLTPTRIGSSIPACRGGAAATPNRGERLGNTRGLSL